jgi:hypothetical protein
MPEAYQSKTPFEVFCLFHTESDGYTYSCQSLVAVFLTNGEAEEALLKLIERAERLSKEQEALEQRYKECHRTKNYDNLPVIATEEKQWRLDNFGRDWIDTLDTNLSNYEIEPWEIGAIRP